MNTPKRRSAHSHLQNKILSYLGRHTVDSLTVLAQELGTHRSSVSRAMHALLAADLVSKTESGWSLTAQGKDELQQIQLELPKRATRTVVSANRLIGLAALSPGISAFDMIRPFTDLSEAAKDAFRLAREESQHSLLITAAAREAIQSLASASDLAKSFTAISEAAELNFAREARVVWQSARVADFVLGVQAQELQRVFGEATARLLSEASAFDSISSAKFASALELMKSFSAKPTLTEIAARQILDIAGDKPQNMLAEIGSKLAQEALVSFSQSQQLNLFFIEQTANLGKITFPAMEELTQANLGIGEIIRDLGIISARDFGAQTVASRIAAGMIPNVAEVARTYRGYFADMVSDIGNSLAGHHRVNWGITIPTRTTSAYIGSVKVAVVVDEAEVEDVDLSEVTLSPREDRAIQLDNVFQDLGPNYLAMWHGSWAVLQSDSPDRIRQASHSGRELLMQFLAELAPDSAFDAKEIEQYGHNGKVTRKMRIGKILEDGSTSAINWTNAVTKALEESYERLAATSHGRGVYPQFTEQQVAGLLHALGGLLVFIQGFRRQ